MGRTTVVKVVILRPLHLDPFCKNRIGGKLLWHEAIPKIPIVLIQFEKSLIPNFFMNTKYKSDAFKSSQYFLDMELGRPEDLNKYILLCTSNTHSRVSSILHFEEDWDLMSIRLLRLLHSHGRWHTNHTGHQEVGQQDSFRNY